MRQWRFQAGGCMWVKLSRKVRARENELRVTGTRTVFKAVGEEEMLRAGADEEAVRAGTPGCVWTVTWGIGTGKGG